MQLQAILLRELCGLNAVVSLPGAGTTDPFFYNKGGKQRGVETPLQWTALMVYILEPLVISWRLRELGFRLGGDFISHAIWADNAVIFASDADMLRIIIAELTEVVYNADLNWKLFSLEVLASYSVEATVKTPVRKEQEGQLLEYTYVDRLLLLGDAFDSKGSSWTPWQHRQEIADSLYLMNAKAFNCHGPVMPRTQAWHDSVVSSALYGAQGWHISAGLLRALRIWELQRLRKVFKLEVKDGESLAECNKRTAVMLFRWFGQASKHMLHHRVLKFIYKSAWREKRFPCNFQENPFSLRQRIS